MGEDEMQITTYDGRSPPAPPATRPLGEIGCEVAAEHRFVSLLAQSKVAQLILADLAHGKVDCLRVAEVEPGYACSRQHGVVLCQLHADALRLQQPEQRRLDGVIGAGRITRCRTDATVFLA